MELRQWQSMVEAMAFWTYSHTRTSLKKWYFEGKNIPLLLEKGLFCSQRCYNRICVRESFLPFQESSISSIIGMRATFY